MAYYIAWLNGCSIKRGTLEEVRATALAIFNSAAWKQTVTDHGKPTRLRITKGSRQTLVSEDLLYTAVIPEDWLNKTKKDIRMTGSETDKDVLSRISHGIEKN